MLYSILMHVIQSCQIRALVRQPRFPKVKPHLTSQRVIQTVDPTGRFRMQHAKHIRKTGSVRSRLRRVSHEVIMIRKNRPRLKVPSEITRNRQQSTMQHSQSMPSPEMMIFPMGTGGHKVSPRLRELMQRGVGPGRLYGWRRIRHSQVLLSLKRHGSARTPKRSRAFEKCVRSRPRLGVRLSSGAFREQ